MFCDLLTETGDRHELPLCIRSTCFEGANVQQLQLDDIRSRVQKFPA